MLFRSEVTVEIADGIKVDVLRGTISDVFTSNTGGAQTAGKGGPTVVGPAANDGKSGGGLLGGLFGGRK